jgi:hypothetical protein
MSTEQLHSTSIVISDLQRSLDVFEGLFVDNLTTEILFQKYPEIGVSLQEAMISKLLITTAAIFCDMDKINGNETLSLSNLIEKNRHKISENTKKIFQDIESQVSGMNLRGLRNSSIAHISLEIAMGNKEVKSHISVNKLRRIYDLTQKFLSILGKESGLLKKNEHMSYYKPIPEDRAPEKFTQAINGTV